MRGYIEEGSTTTPFDMVVANELSRYHLAIEAIERAPQEEASAEARNAAVEQYRRQLERHADYIREHGQELPEVRDWKWTEATR